MRIVTLINGLNNGGAEKFAVELCNELSEKHEVYLFVKGSLTQEMIPPKLIGNKVRLVVFNSDRKWDIVFAFKQLTYLIRLKPDIIHLHSSILVFYVFFLPLILSKPRIIHTIHNQLTPAYQKTLRFLSFFKKLARKIDQVVISDKIREEFQEKFKNQKFCVIVNGIKGKEDYSSIWRYPDDGCLRLIAVGHFGPAKRFDLLVDVMGNNVIRDCFRLSIIGKEKNSKQPITQYIESKKLNNVQLLGLKENVRKYLAEADALVIWSSFEGMPLVMLESLSVGCPVISSPVGGIPDVVQQGKNGMLTNGLDNDDLIKTLLEFKSLKESEMMDFRKKSREVFLNQYSIEFCTSQYESLFLRKP